MSGPREEARGEARGTQNPGCKDNAPKLMAPTTLKELGKRCQVVWREKDVTLREGGHRRGFPPVLLPVFVNRVLLDQPHLFVYMCLWLRSRDNF